MNDTSMPPPEVRMHEWFRVKVGSAKIVAISYRGEGEIGPREIDKLIQVLEAQKAVLAEPAP